MSSSVKDLIKKAIGKNEFLRKLEKGQVNDMVDCMSVKEFKQEQYIIREGSTGNELYVIEGKFTIRFVCI